MGTASFNVLSKASALIVTLSATAVAAHHCGPSKFGAVTVALTLQFIICEIVDYGHSTQTARRVTQDRTPSVWVEEIPNLLIKSAVVAVILQILIWAFMKKLDVSIWIIFLNAPFWLANVYYQQICYMGKKLAQANYMIIIQSFGLICILIYIRIPIFSNVAYELSVLTGSVASFIYSLYISSNSSTKRRKIKFLKHKYTIRANINNYKNQFAAPRIIGNLLMLDIAFINIIFGNQSSGLYSAAARLRTVLPLGIQSIADISLATPIGKKNLKNILFQKDFVVIFFGTLVAAIILEVFTPLYISIIFGYQYRSIVFLTRIFILTAIISGILAIARSLLIAWKLESIITNAYLVMFTFLLPIFFLGVLYFGVKWAAISQLIAYFLLTLFLCKRIVRLATVK